jgi:hypothetical protein
MEVTDPLGHILGFLGWLSVPHCLIYWAQENDYYKDQPIAIAKPFHEAAKRRDYI